MGEAVHPITKYTLVNRARPPAIKSIVRPEVRVVGREARGGEGLIKQCIVDRVVIRLGWRGGGSEEGMAGKGGQT